jgi:arylsulfate sulfotransferase
MDQKPSASKAGNAVLPLLISLVIAFSLTCNAITIVSGPTFTPSANAPLAGALKVTTDVNSRVSVQVTNGTNVWQRNFYGYSTVHSNALMGFKPGSTNSILVTVYDEQRNTSTASQPLTFITPALPQFFPVYTILTNNPSAMEPGYIFFAIRNNTASQGFIAAMDNNGNVVWYMRLPNFFDVDVQPLANGNIFIPGATGQFAEYDMLGNTLQTWTPPAGYPINTHDGYPSADGTSILYLSDQTKVVSNFPVNDTNSDAGLVTTNVDDNPAVEISITNEALLNIWSPLNLGLLDPTRVTYLTYDAPSPSYGVDNEHANALVEDTNDNSLIISMRNQNEVVKFDRTTGQVKWILSPPALWGADWQPYLLTPVGTPFDWNYGEHAPNISAQGTLLIYNDNNYAASPFDAFVVDSNNFSSGIEYAIDVTNMTVSEVWNSSWQTNQDRLYTPYIGRVQSLPKTTNVLVDFGAITYINGVHPSPTAAGATMVRIREYTHDSIPQVVFDASFWNTTNNSPIYSGNFCYRAYQIPDLYPHPAEPVADLAVGVSNNVPILEFANDPANSYQVQASTDLINWTNIGTAVESTNAGEYNFSDLQADQYSSRFYRVVTQ